MAVFSFASSTGFSEMITVSPLLWEEVTLSTWKTFLTASFTWDSHYNFLFVVSLNTSSFLFSSFIYCHVGKTRHLITSFSQSGSGCLPDRVSVRSQSWLFCSCWPDPGHMSLHCPHRSVFSYISHTVHHPLSAFLHVCWSASQMRSDRSCSHESGFALHYLQKVIRRNYNVIN